MSRLSHVLVTGAGGSIGSALSKALARAGVESLMLLDSSELSLFELQDHLARTFPNVSTKFVLGSVDDASLLDSIFSRHRIDLIYHAAAWKQVPLLESNPFSAVQNNSVGTHILAHAAMRAGVAKLVLISTDKAVNPRSIMGVSKRIAELVVTSLSNSNCGMNAIRLCNVAGSSGSVVPLFLGQIARREPVTVTDPQVSRWFLTSEQAIEAIMDCGASYQRGKIMLPSVGEPMRIVDLARFLIQSNGEGWPGEVVYIGLRPGEKLTEELVFESERKLQMEGCLTVLQTPTLRVDQLSAFMDELTERIKLRDLPATLRTIRSVVPEYVPGPLLFEAVASAVGHG